MSGKRRMGLVPCRVDDGNAHVRAIRVAGVKGDLLEGEVGRSGLIEGVDMICARAADAAILHESAPAPCQRSDRRECRSARRLCRAGMMFLTSGPAGRAPSPICWPQHRRLRNDDHLVRHKIAIHRDGRGQRTGIGAAATGALPAPAGVDLKRSAISGGINTVPAAPPCRGAGRISSAGRIGAAGRIGRLRPCRLRRRGGEKAARSSAAQTRRTPLSGLLVRGIRLPSGDHRFHQRRLCKRRRDGIIVRNRRRRNTDLERARRAWTIRRSSRRRLSKARRCPPIWHPA